MTWQLATEGFLVAADDAIENGRVVHHGGRGVKAPAGLRHAFRTGDERTPCGKDVAGLWSEWGRSFEPDSSNDYCEICSDAAKP